nr:zinc ribbon domain-containing protein [Clostridia bacterium]
MKKLLICLTALALLLSSAALADAVIEASQELERSIFLSTGTNCYYQRTQAGYVLFDADGNALSAAYPELTAKWNGKYYEYRYESGLNTIGLLDANGQVLTPPAYGKISFSNETWGVAYVLEPTTAEVGDMKDSDNNQYMVARTDVLYEGHVIGSFTRDEFNPSLRWGTCGKYLYVKTTSDAGFYISPNFDIVRVDKDFTTLEFSSVYKKGTFHNPTQQWAFTPGCTLTENDVTYSVIYDDQKDALIDLQGNVIKSGLVYDRVTARGDYFQIRMNSLYGIMDKQGNVIAQPIYADIPSYSAYFANGYQTAITPEGHLHFIDKQGNVTAKAEYELSANDYKGSSNSAVFAVVNNLGKYIVFTATRGQLPETYEDFNTPNTRHQLLLVQKGGKWGAIDVNGNVVLPFIFRYAPTMSADSTLVYGTDDESNRLFYKLSFTNETTVPDSWTETKTSGEDMDTTPALAEGAWECACGTITNGKFCPECGAKKPEPTPAPAADGSWDCTCGSHNTGKFCPECGTKKPEAPVEPQCANCGYKPGETAPKFCPECGTKF